MSITSRRILGTTAAAALAIGASALPVNAAATAENPSDVSPRTVERLYTACVDGAPTTPDTHERWAAGCSERAATGLS
jgi:invasion protein IalB